jgi:hypothetical protein
MKVGDIVRAKLVVKGFGEFEWEDEIVSIDGVWHRLKDSHICVNESFLSPILSPIPENTIVECWNGGNDNSSSLGWYIKYDKIKGQHLVAKIKNMIEGRTWWDNARRMDSVIVNELLKAGNK